MCGIVAAFGEIDAEKCERMINRVQHRGPDDTGTLALPGAWLGHQRLSIIDVSGGRQPLTDSDERAWIVGNGEIYNHERLRAALPEGTMLTRSDTEVALHWVMRDGMVALRELRGMFALAMADADGNGLVARDDMGVKPLYWAQLGATTLFASELRAFDPEDRPLVESFPPGCAWTPHTGLVRFTDAVPVDIRPARRAAEPTWDDSVLSKLRLAIIDAVHRRMMSDVGVGVFLSGGLDSAIVAAIAARHAQRAGEVLPTFAVGTEGSADLIAARKVAEHIGSDHHEIIATPEAIRAALDDAVMVIEHYDPALVRSAVPNLLLARETAKKVKVVLTGEGADELFAGYDYLHTGEFAVPDALHAELVRMIDDLHHLNLQRCDRTTMYFGLEARVPFLDRDVVHAALSVPPEWKQFTPDRPVKALLRESFKGWLPDELLWRGKEQFGDGSGAGAVLTAPTPPTPARQPDNHTATTSPATAPAATADPADAPAANAGPAAGPTSPRTAGASVGSSNGASPDPSTPTANGDTWAIRSPEEAAYYAIWQRHFAGIRPTANLGAFATT